MTNNPNTKKILCPDADQETIISQYLLSGVEQGHFDVALYNVDILKEQFPNNHRLWFWKMMAKLQCRNLSELVNKGYPINKDPDFLKALACADPLQAQSYRNIAKQVLFTTHTKCQIGLTEETGLKETTLHWMELYLNNCDPEDPYGTIYRTLHKVPHKNWNNALITGALIHIQDIYRTQISNGTLKELDSEQFRDDICDHIQAPGKYLHLESFIIERLKKSKEEIPDKAPKGTLIPPKPLVHTRKSTLKALQNPAPRTTSGDYVSQLLRQYTPPEPQHPWNISRPMPSSTPVGPNYSDHVIRRWCEPDCVFSNASGLPMLPLPAEAVTPPDPQEAWRRYVQISRRVVTTDFLVYCAKKVRELAPQELGNQTYLRDKLLNQMVESSTGSYVGYYLETMQDLYPDDYRTHYIYLKNLTKDFQRPGTFKRPYQSLNQRLSQLKKRDTEGAEKLKAQYVKLATEILDYMKPFAQASTSHAEPMASQQAAGQIPAAHHDMLTDWLKWWQPLKDETDDLLRQIGEDSKKLEKIINRKQKGFSLFRR